MKRLRDLREGDVGRMKGRLFIVKSRYPEDRVSGSTHVVFQDGEAQVFLWDNSDPTVEHVGKGHFINDVRTWEKK